MCRLPSAEVVSFSKELSLSFSPARSLLVSFQKALAECVHKVAGVKFALSGLAVRIERGCQVL